MEKDSIGYCPLTIDWARSFLGVRAALYDYTPLADGSTPPSETPSRTQRIYTSRRCSS